MIRIEVEDYCQDCHEFEAESENGRVIIYINDEPLRELGDSIVRCKYRNKCSHIKQYLERYLKGE